MNVQGSLAGNQAMPSSFQSPLHVAGASQYEKSSQGSNSPPQQGPYRPSPDETGRSGPGQQAIGDAKVPTATTHVQYAGLSDSRSQSMTGNNSAIDFHSRYDFAPSGGPPSLQVQGHAWHPPRKSSLGQDNAPPQLNTPETSSSAQVEHLPAFQIPRERAGSGQNKSLPFVRPADIYRRLEEERERERQSQDSVRPSLDTLTSRPKEPPITGSQENAGHIQHVQAQFDPVMEKRSEPVTESTKQHEDDSVTRSSLENAGDRGSKFRASNLPSTGASDPVTQGPSQRKSLQSNDFEPSAKMTSGRHSTCKSFDPADSNHSANRGPSLSPMLPELNRVSGFGASFGESFMGASPGLDGFSTSTGADDKLPQQVPQQAPAVAEPKRSDLQHQPSLGFTSAVHQSFDAAQEQVPPTPSSTADSSVQRSASGGTSAVSPIISRGPSSATQVLSNPLPAIADVVSPVQQADDSEERPKSSSTLGTPTQGRPFGAHASGPASPGTSPPPSFIPGHRRDMSTPSPDNSPARTPVLETKLPARQPQEVELATSTLTPTDADPTSAIDSEEGHVIPLEDSLKPKHCPEFSTVTKTPAPKLETKHTPKLTIGKSQERTGSPDSGKVKNLAEKFESNSRPESPRIMPRQGLSRPDVLPGETALSSRSQTDRLEGFRPPIPGGWQSSTSIMPLRSSSPEKPKAVDSSTPDAKQDVNYPATKPVDEGNQSLNVVVQVKDVSKDAFAAAATAGSALAGAFAAAAGVESGNSDPDAEPSLLKLDNSTEGNIISRPVDIPPPLTLNSGYSSSAPSPLPKDTPRKEELENHATHYFATQRDITQPALDSQKPSTQQRALPSLSTDLTNHEFESDRLRREIVRELSPNVASESTTAESDSPYQASSRYSTNQSAAPTSDPKSGDPQKGHRNYWDEEGLETEPVPSRTVFEPNTNLQSQPQSSLAREHRSADPSENLASQESSAAPPAPPKPLTHRFSWEQPLQELGPPTAAGQDHEAAPVVDDNQMDFVPTPNRGHNDLGSDQLESARSSTVIETSTLGLNDSIRRPATKETTFPHSNILAAPIKDEIDLKRELSSHSEGLKVAQTWSAHEEHAERTLEPLTHTDTEPPARSVTVETQPLGANIHGPNQQAPQDSQSIITQPIPVPSTNIQAKIPPFREILALKSAADRIRTYNQSRDQFANLDTGLSHWLASTANALPEHADLITNQGRTSIVFQGHKSSPSRTKLGSIVPSGSSQQPPGFDIGGSPSAAYTASGASGGKISSQQVQAKSKELLHSAGIFGGKANVAAKGLFSKGKSKLRGSGGLDKV